MATRTLARSESSQKRRACFDEQNLKENEKLIVSAVGLA